jgi:micrococcal nuclease
MGAQFMYDNAAFAKSLGCILDRGFRKSNVNLGSYVLQLKYVVDGDTVVFFTKKNERIVVRLLHIDAPEHDQPHAELSKNYLLSLLNEKLVVVLSGVDKYGRFLGFLELMGVDINLYMLRQGFVWLYSRNSYPSFYFNALLEAQKRILGIWEFSDNIDPWLWRRGVRQ